jgi:type IV secretory pathway TraG/TraD family ATPase VirD4
MNDKEDGFSIQEWIKDDSQRGWLFLVSMPDQRETLRPLMSSWLNIAINSLMACKPSQDRRLWFIIDEKQSLNKIEALPKALAEIRKYGGCIVAGLQNISQLDKLYGHESRKTMSSLYNTKIFFRSPDTDTAQWISKMIGEHEVLENNEGISFGAHQMRDGVSLTEHKKQKAIVPYSELLNLKDLEAYIKLPEDYPVSKLTFKYKEIESKNEAFIERQFNLESESTCEDNTVNLEIFDEEVDDHVSDNGKKINLLRIG